MLKTLCQDNPPQTHEFKQCEGYKEKYVYKVTLKTEEGQCRNLRESLMCSTGLKPNWDRVWYQNSILTENHNIELE